MSDPTVLRKELDQAFDAFQQMAADEIAYHMEQVADDWHARFPKRSLLFKEGLPCCVWRVDGTDTIHARWWKTGDSRRRYEAIFEPLETGMTWYCLAADAFGISIDNIERPSKTPEQLMLPDQ